MRVFVEYGLILRTVYVVEGEGLYLKVGPAHNGVSEAIRQVFLREDDPVAAIHSKERGVLLINHVEGEGTLDDTPWDAP